MRRLRRAFHTNLLRVIDARAVPESPSSLLSYPRITALEASTHTAAPRACTMLVRDFIHRLPSTTRTTAIFSKTAEILHQPEPVDFQSVRDSLAFANVLAERYSLDASERARPLWHTPSELFRVWLNLRYAADTRVWWVAMVCAGDCPLSRDGIQIVRISAA